MKLTDRWFEAEFYGQVFKDRPCTDPHCAVVSPQPHTHSGWIRQGARIEGAQGLFLWCPCGYGTDKCHGLIVPFANPRNAPPLPPNHGPISRDGKARPRWQMTGTSLADLSTQPSIAVGEAPECWHGYITNGDVK